MSIEALTYLGSGRPVGPSAGRSGFHRGVLLIVYAVDTGSNGLIHMVYLISQCIWYVRLY